MRLNRSAIEKNIKSITLSENADLGLYQGCMGLSLVLLMIGKIKKDSLATKQAHKILDTISNEISNLRVTDFKTGIAGIGWCVEWLVQNKFLDNTNTDEVLEDVDDLVYRSIVFKKSYDTSVEEGIMGKLLYYNRRLKSNNPGFNVYRRIPNEACMRWLVDGINEVVREKEFFISSHGKADKIIELAKSLKIFSFILSAYPKSEKALFFFIKQADTSILEAIKKIEKNDGKINAEIFIKYFYLNACYLNCAKKINHLECVKRSSIYLKKLHIYFPVKFSQIETGQLFMLLDSVMLVEKYSIHKKYRVSIEEIIANLKNRKLPFQLHNGWGQLTLAELFLSDYSIPNPFFEF